MDKVYVIVENDRYITNSGLYIGTESAVRGVCGSIESCSKRVSEIIKDRYIYVDKNYRKYFDGNGRLDVIMDYIMNGGFLRYYDDERHIVTAIQIQEYNVVK